MALFFPKLKFLASKHYLRPVSLVGFYSFRAVSGKSLCDLNIPSSKMPTIKDVMESLTSIESTDEMRKKVVYPFLMSSYELDKDLGEFEGQQKPQKTDEDFIKLKKQKSLLEKVRFMNFLRRDSIPLTEEMVDHFMSAAVAEKKPSVVRDTILEIGLNGLSPSSEHYRMLMAAYCRKGQMGNAKTVLNMIKANGQVGTPDMYCEVIYGHFKAKQLALGWKAYYRIKEDGIEETENVMINVMRLCTLERNSRKAINFLEQHEMAGNLLTKDIYSCCIMACASSENLEDEGISEAFNLFEKMLLNRMDPDEKTFNSLIYASLRLKDIDMGMRIVELMEKRGIVKSFATYTQMIGAVSQTLNIGRIPIQGKSIDVKTRIEMALSLAEECKQKGLVSTRRKEFQLQKQIFRIYYKSRALKRLMEVFKSIQKTDSKSKEFQGIVKNVFDLMLLSKRLEFCTESLSLMKNQKIPQMSKKYLMKLLAKNDNSKLIQLCTLELGRLGTFFTPLESDYINKKMDAKKRIVFEELINRDIMKLQLSERIGHLKLPKSRRKRAWILRKHGLKNPVDGFRKVPVVDPNSEKGFTIKSSDKRRRSYI